MATTAPSRRELQSLMFQALAEPIGLLLLASDPQLARERLHQAKIGQPELKEIQIRLVRIGDEGNVVLVKRKMPPTQPHDTREQEELEL